MKKIANRAPVLLLILSTGILFTIIGLCGKWTIYANTVYEPWKEPVLALVFQGIHEEIYPWQWFVGAGSPNAVASREADSDISGAEGELQALSPGKELKENWSLPENSEILKTENIVRETVKEQVAGAGGDDFGADGDAAPPDQEADGNGADSTADEDRGGEENTALNEPEEIKPLRESTYEEYMNHISADIYGTAGVERAAEYEFVPVTESYFDDALFIGDSRTVGLRDYTALAERADFLCATSLTIYKVLEDNIGKAGTAEAALQEHEYGKIYLSVGINELGRGTTEDFIGKYSEVVRKLRELEPEAVIIVQSIMSVSAEWDAREDIFNNDNIRARNHALATLADNRNVFYVDVNEAVCDEEGNLKEEYTYDAIHLLGVYNELIMEFLMEHGVEVNGI